MKKAALIILLFIPLFAGAQTSNMARIIAREMLRVGSDTSKYWTSITHSVTAASTNRQAPTAKAVWDMSVKERMYFNTAAPTDTNLVWAKSNSAPWKLDSVFSYEFGSWHIAGFYDRISGVFSEKPPLFVVATGQSNMVGIDGGGDTTTDRRLVAWDTTAHIWKVANPTVNPFNSTGANSLAFAFGREVARRENRIVRLVVMAKSSQSIEQWFGSSTTSIAYNTNLNVIQSGMPRCDVILWHQGESNHDGAGGVCHDNTCYTDSLNAIIRQFRGYTWADERTLFIAGGLFDGAGATQQDRNGALMTLNSDTISTTGFAYATGLDDSGDAVHFSGPSLVTLGNERYYNVYRSLPNLHNHSTGGGTVDLATGVTGTLPAVNGGTGIASYTVGDILYASGTTALSTLADVATGNALISGGVAVAPSYGKIGLTTHVSGTLPVTSGGTGLTSATQGDIVYASAANTYSLLAKNTTATRYLSNTGTSNNPAWAQVALSTGVSGTLPVANGGTGAASFTANRILYGNGTSAIQSNSNFTFDPSTLKLSHSGSRSMSSSGNIANLSGTITSTANSVVGVGLNMDQTFSNSGTQTGNQFKQQYGSFTVSGSTKADYIMGRQLYLANYSPNITNFYGDWITCLVRPATGTATQTIYGNRVDVNRYDATDDAHNATGLYGKVADFTSTGRYNIGIGLNYTVESAKTGTGIAATVDTRKGTTGNTQYGIQLANNVTGAYIVDNAYGIRLSATEASSGVITNYYGIYQNSVPTGGTLAYFLYNNNNARSYTNGSFAIGTDATTAKLLVRGSGTTSSTYSGIFEKSDGTDVLTVRDDGRIGVLVTSPQTTLDASGGTDGVVLPVGTDAQRPSVNGTIRGNSDNGGVEYRVGNQWYRLVASQTPSVAAGAAAGTGATAILFDGSNDLAGGVTLTTGTSATTGTLFTLTFADAFFTGLVIKVTLTPADSDAAAEITKYYVSSASTTTFVVTAATALTDSTEYKIYYQIGQ